MNRDEIDEMLVEWELARQQGRELEANELAADQPHLVDELRKRIAALKATSWMVDETLNMEDWTLAVAEATTVGGGSASLGRSFIDLTSDDFLEAIYNSRILTGAEVRWLKELVAAHGSHLEPLDLAERLVDEQLLTSYQANVLLSRKNSPLVLDRYIVLDVLGAGGMGLVYKAMHQSMERVVALKVLPRHAVDSPTKVSRFRREIKAAAKLTHPNIVAAYDAHEADGMCFLVMEYVAGEDLKKTVMENGPLAVSDAVGIIYLIASALGEAHRQEIVHRDVKPSNILLSDDGVPKLLDLGLARVKETVSHESSNQLTREGLAMGTAAYMAPEQARDPRAVDARADIYSLGCTLYFLLVGRPVFERTSSLETILAHVEEKAPTLLDAEADVPDSLERVFRKMVAKNPVDRYASMKQVCEALETHGLVDPQLISGSSIHRARPGTQAKAKSRWGVATRLAGYAAAAVVVAALAWGVSRWLSPGMTDREYATWVLANGGVVTADTSFGTQTYHQGADLPADELRVVGVELRDTGSPFSLQPVVELGHVRALVLRDFARPRLPLAELPELGRLRGLGLVASKLRDEDLTAVVGMSVLENLDVSDNELTDAALAHIVELKNLESLSLAGTAISDRGLRQLRELPRLKTLTLDRCTIADRGVEALLPLTELEQLSLNGTAIGDKGLAALAGLPKLHHIELADTSVTLDGLDGLREFPALRHLRVSQFEVSGALIGAVRSVPTIESLDLSGSNLDDTALARLGNLKQLKVLDVRGTGVSEAARQRLAAALPDCRIIGD